jgi:2-polyprenyl-3-methyl-5-hydroxy-6-metoxy-1,4-benzoquinol methylase
MPDQRTNAYYEENSQALFTRYESVNSKISDYFDVSYPKGSEILDVGSGSGRDVNALLSKGYQAYGIEPTKGFIEQAINKNSQLKDRLFSGSLPNIPTEKIYDGVLCSAVLMHLPKTELFDSLINLRGLLKSGGRLLVSIPSERPELNSERRDLDGRLFEKLHPEYLILLCARLGLELVSSFKNDDSLNRAGHSWITLLFQKSSGTGRTLDRIESVLRNDKKSATYKLALLRALCDLAERDDAAVLWRPDNIVSIPILNIAEVWLIYYWPLLDTVSLVPQNNAEASEGRSIAFRSELNELIHLCYQYFQAETATFSLFYLEWKKGSLPENIRKVLTKALKKIANTIKVGPVKYADNGAMFSFDKKTSSVLVDAELWREFCLTGYWVKDSLLLRWSELTEQFSKKLSSPITSGEVLNLLLTHPQIDREQSLARKIYLSDPNITLRCVWSGRHLDSRTLDVDHVLPYSLLRNNELWNLLPAHKKVNNEKRAKIPSSQQLNQSKDFIIENWQLLRVTEPGVFNFEVQRALGSMKPSSWENDLFRYLKFKSNHAIYARGAEPWEFSNSDTG